MATVIVYSIISELNYIIVLLADSLSSVSRLSLRYYYHIPSDSDQSDIILDRLWDRDSSLMLAQKTKRIANKESSNYYHVPPDSD